MIWFIVLTTIMNNGDVYAEVQFPLDPKYNNEQSCNEAGQLLVDQKQMEIGTNAGKTYVICKAISPEEIKACILKDHEETLKNYFDR